MVGVTLSVPRGLVWPEGGSPSLEELVPLETPLIAPLSEQLPEGGRAPGRGMNGTRFTQADIQSLGASLGEGKERHEPSPVGVGATTTRRAERVAVGR